MMQRLGSLVLVTGSLFIHSNGAAAQPTSDDKKMIQMLLKKIASDDKGPFSGLRAIEELARRAGPLREHRKDVLAAIRTQIAESRAFDGQRGAELVASLADGGIEDLADILSNKETPDNLFQLVASGVARAKSERAKIIAALRPIAKDERLPDHRRAMISLASVLLGDDSKETSDVLVKSISSDHIVRGDCCFMIIAVGPQELKNDSLKKELRKHIVLDVPEKELSELRPVELAGLATSAHVLYRIDPVAYLASEKSIQRLLKASLAQENLAPMEYSLILSKAYLDAGKDPTPLDGLFRDWKKLLLRSTGFAFAETAQNVYILMDEKLAESLVSRLKGAKSDEEARFAAALLECGGLKSGRAVDALAKYIRTTEKRDRAVLAAKVLGRICALDQVGIVDALIKDSNGNVKDALQQARADILSVTAESPFRHVSAMLTHE